MIVVDLGYCVHDGDTSMPQLLKRFEPDLFYGFDPLADDESYQLNGTKIQVQAKAAWMYDGFGELGTGAPSLLDATMLRAKDDRGEWRASRLVRTFDFAKWLERLPEPAVVKMNIEGAEFPLLEHIIEAGASEKIERLIVQWHDHRLGPEFTKRRQAIEQALRCPVEDWTL